jgi:hypothetical protein
MFINIQEEISNEWRLNFGFVFLINKVWNKFLFLDCSYGIDFIAFYFVND